ncbi:hypothetical protein [Microbacterium sp. LWO12-1.2]|uniref:hypothetical protein n=1 Tax=Microbacterium sp. LWO12-1.2 TaxID=3135261 RepID=UPI00341C404F
MVVLAVRFEDEQSSHHEVDASDTIDAHLAVQTDAEDVLPKSQQRFQTALRVSAGEVDEPASARRHTRADIRASRTREQALVPRGFEGSEKGLLSSTVVEMHERCGDVDGAETSLAPEVVRDACASGVRMPAAVLAEPDMQSAIVQRPDAVSPQRRSAGQGATVRGCGADLGIRSWHGEDTGANAFDALGPNVAGEAFASYAVTL